MAMQNCFKVCFSAVSPLFNKTCATWMWLLWIFKGAVGLSCIRYGPPTQQHFFIVGKSNLQSASTSYYVMYFPTGGVASNQILGGPPRVTTLRRSNFPLKRKKEREGESLALLQI